jgi:hypothetical protein
MNGHDERSGTMNAHERSGAMNGQERLGTFKSERSNALERIVENGHGTFTLTHQNERITAKYSHSFNGAVTVL